MLDPRRLHREVEARTALEIAETPHAELLVGATVAAAEALIREEIPREDAVRGLDFEARPEIHRLHRNRHWIREAVEEVRRG